MTELEYKRKLKKLKKKIKNLKNNFIVSNAKYSIGDIVKSCVFPGISQVREGKIVKIYYTEEFGFEYKIYIITATDSYYSRESERDILKMNKENT